MAKPQIVITVKGGLINDIDFPDELKGQVEVVVNDHDDADPERDDYRQDDDGTEYHQQLWNA